MSTAIRFSEPAGESDGLDIDIRRAPLGGRIPTDASPELKDACSAVEEFTERLFGVRPDLIIDEDCELGSRYLVARVAIESDVSAAADLYQDWHRELGRRLGAAANHFRLSLELQ